jgi:hypothetical protein
MHYLEPYPTPDMEHSLVFEDVLDAMEFRKAWLLRCRHSNSAG